MTWIAVPAIVALISYSSVIQKDHVAVPAPTLVSLSEVSVDLGPRGVTAGSCISIQQDGHLHIEIRFQQLPQNEASLHIYESSLDEYRLDRLKDLLDDRSVRDLNAITPPVMPVSSARFAWSVVRIPRDGTLRKVGYFAWEKQAGREKESPESTPDSVKEEWRTARTALVPLERFLHEVEGMKWPEVSNSHSNFCGVDVDER